MNHPTALSSYTQVRFRFSGEDAAAKYATRHGGNPRDRREQRCILSALAGLARGTRILDLPCGVGRLAPTLVAQGYHVTGADSSPQMVAVARREWIGQCSASPDLLSQADFDVQDIMATGFADGQFDAVICNRLFHHYGEPDTRCRVFRELRRIAAGRIIVSFFNRMSLDALRMALLRTFAGRFQGDRFLISVRTLAREAETAGLLLNRVIPTRCGISPQCYAVFTPASSAAAF